MELYLQKNLMETNHYFLNDFEQSLFNFGKRVEIICAMEMGGKIDPETAYQQIKSELRELKKSRKINKENLQ